jgi:monoterpene epsilon-lactone hydrolase
MSLRAEVLRLALRCFKDRKGARPDIAAIRRRLEAVKVIVPNPPKGTKAVRLLAGGVPAVRVTTPQSRDDCHILYLHGGAYVYGAPTHYRDFIWRIANVTGASVLCLDYRLAPEHPFPAAVDDAVSAYRWLLAEGCNPRRMAIMGDSAGGGLTFGTLLKLRDERVALPAAAVALSPWTDLALTGETLLSGHQARTFVDWYLAGADSRHPYASPLYGDPTGLPPTLIQVGSDEILLDDAKRMADRLRNAGCTSELEIWPRMPHVWQLFARVLPEGRRAVERIGEFVLATTGWPQAAKSPRRRT